MEKANFLKLSESFTTLPQKLRIYAIFNQGEQFLVDQLLLA